MQEFLQVVSTNFEKHTEFCEECDGYGIVTLGRYQVLRGLVTTIGQCRICKGKGMKEVLKVGGK